MSRPLRIEYPGAFYHITSRGNARQKIFNNNNDYANFIDILERVMERYGWKCYAYCLMPNHYHILIKTPVPNLSAGMRQLNGVYTQKFNYTYKRVGHLFQGRYKAIVIDENRYFYELIRYIVLNPVRAKIVKIPSDWKWSSHREMLLKNKEEICIAKKEVIYKFENIAEYKKYINERVDNIDFSDELRGGLILGSLDFVEKIKSKIRKQAGLGSNEYPRKEKLALSPGLDKIIIKAKIADKQSRNKMIARAYGEYSYSLSEIGRYLGLHYSAISKIIKKEETKKS